MAETCHHDNLKFQHTAARRRLGWQGSILRSTMGFNTQPPEGGWFQSAISLDSYKGFNTQPPEGGWISMFMLDGPHIKFQHTAARRRLEVDFQRYDLVALVSTHSRPKAAGKCLKKCVCGLCVSTHSRPKAAGVPRPDLKPNSPVSTHSRPKAAGVR